jgi:2-phosphosulfolactate phosphatase
VAAESVFSQPGAGARLDWGSTGAAELSRACAVLVVVDVLSFSTAVDVAVARYTRVHPFPWAGVVAAGRSEVTADRPWSLSPAALRRAPAVADLVLPSPNGAAICAAAASTGIPVYSACLRNARAVAGWLRAHGYGRPDSAVGVVAAGELWPDGTLRPCVEDLLGAAIVIDGLASGEVRLSVEAAVALAALAAVPDVPAAVNGCVSGQELLAAGYADDVAVAVEIDSSSVVPALRSGAFSDAGGL